MTDLNVRWSTARGEPTLESLRAFVGEVSQDLDPGSRYVSELLAVLDACKSVEDYKRRLEDRDRVETFRQDGAVPSGGERGRSWVDETTWSGMDLYERTLANLLTGETRMMWAAEGAINFTLLPEVLKGLPSPRRALSIPCSTGKEPFSIVIAALRSQLEVSVVGVDRQASYVERARAGSLIPHWRDMELPGVDIYLHWDESSRRATVDPSVLSRVSFEQGDVLTGELPEGPFELVSCRNLLGYFRGETLRTAVTNVMSRVAEGGVLLFDPFVSGSKEMAPVREELMAAGYTRRYENADFYAKA